MSELCEECHKELAYNEAQKNFSGHVFCNDCYDECIGDETDFYRDIETEHHETPEIEDYSGLEL